MEKTKLLIAHHRHQQYRKYLQQREQSLEIESFDFRQPIPFKSSEAEILICWKFPPDLFERLPRLRWISAAAAGVNHILAALPPDSEVAVTKAEATMGDFMADYVIAYMLYHTRRMSEVESQGRMRIWRHLQPQLLRRHTIGILGLGAIGSKIAARAAALGMTVLGAKRKPALSPDCKRLFSGSGWRKMLPLCDFLVVALPFTPQTEKMIGARELVKMKREAVLINISRGEVVDEAALIDALRSETIAGAVLDVFNEEPLPVDHPFWEMPNVVVTPHCAGPSEDVPICDEFLENYKRWTSGQPLLKVADPKRGY